MSTESKSTETTNPETTSGPRVGIVVVTYSPGDSLDTLLDSLPAAGAGDSPVVLADNGSLDGSVERAATRPGVTLVRTGGNLGYGTAANAGARSLIEQVAPGIEYVLLCNPDLVLGPDSIRALATVADAMPTGGSFGPVIRTPDGRVYPSARELPSIGRGIGHAVTGWWWPGNPWTRAYRRQDEAPSTRPAGWLSGACLLLRRTAFEQVGGFDESYFMYFEDVDLGARLVGAGWQNVWVAEAEVMHTGGHATERDPGPMAVEHHRSAYRYLSRAYDAWWQAPLRWALRAGLAARGALARRSRAVSSGAALPEA